MNLKPTANEIKENLESEFAKLETAIKRIRTVDENSNYSYTLEDVESDLAKMRLVIEKNASTNEEFKNLFEKVIEGHKHLWRLYKNNNGSL